MSAGLVLLATNTHLYRGARLIASDDELRPRAARLVLADGVEVDAELLAGVDADVLGLAVPAYRTAAGTQIAAQVWEIARVERDADGAAVLVVGPRAG
ncbi:MAG: hypothetical protein QM677_07160 [Microbacterium sp.]